ncbi:MAG TPA: tetratricopeptide repeat protein [Pedomonas sp.]|uniref:tetratricopeptide repeat protein n=1 Tax=Pedomonas sp. TaxID=2976421 RepID=UPI002F42B6A1
MACVDNYGLPLSTASDKAARLYRDGVALMLAAWPGAAETLDTALEADPDFALAHAARARLHAMRAEPGEAHARIVIARQKVASKGSEREQSHVEALALAITGQSQKALEHALTHAERWPQDTVILSLPLGAFGLFAFSGRADHNQARVDLCERHARHFNADDWWFLTYRGWALAENGAAYRGRAMLERAFELRRENANGVHALVHAMFEGGAGDEAEALIAGWLPDYDRSGILHGHIAWHAALAALERGDADAALALYADHVQPSASQGTPINIVSDAASLLWRLKVYGHALPQGLWQQAADYARQAFPRPGHSFIDPHMALIEAATNQRAALAQRITMLEERIGNGSLGAGWVVPAIARAVQAFVEADYAGCVRILEPYAEDVVRIGGSGAQREVIEDTLVVALMRGGEIEKARALLDRRLHRRPSPRDARWRAQLTA